MVSHCQSFDLLPQTATDVYGERTYIRVYTGSGTRVETDVQQRTWLSRSSRGKWVLTRCQWTVASTKQHHRPTADILSASVTVSALPTLKD